MARILNTKQAAEKLQVKPLTVRKYLRKGLIPGKRLGREWRIVETDLEMFLRGSAPARGLFANSPEELIESKQEEIELDAEESRRHWEALSPKERRKRIDAVLSKYQPAPGAVDRFLAEKRAETEAEERRHDERRGA